MDIIFVFVALFGAIVGSFLNVVIVRLPRETESIVFPASHCPVCKGDIAWYDNLPIVSFLLLQGKCRHCRAPISLRYPLVECSMLLLAVGLYAKFSLSVAFAVYFVYVAALLAIFFIDAAHQIIPDSISLPGIVAGFLASFLTPYLTWQDSGIGILFGGGTLFLVAAGYYMLTKREGMGGGDIKLLAMIGAFQGWQAIPFVIFSSSLLGTFFGVWAMIRQKKGGKTVVPYGPFLVAGSFLFLYFREYIEGLMSMLFLPHA